MVPVSPQTQPSFAYNPCGMQSTVLYSPGSMFPGGGAPMGPFCLPQMQSSGKKSHKKKKKKKRRKSDSDSDSDSDSSSDSKKKVEYVYVRKPGQQQRSEWSRIVEKWVVRSGVTGGGGGRGGPPRVTPPGGGF